MGGISAGRETAAAFTAGDGAGTVDSAWVSGPVGWSESFPTSAPSWVPSPAFSLARAIASSEAVGRRTPAGTAGAAGAACSASSSRCSAAEEPRPEERFGMASVAEPCRSCPAWSDSSITAVS